MLTVTDWQSRSQLSEHQGRREPGGHTQAPVPSCYAAREVMCVAMLPGGLGDTAAVT